MDAPSKEESSTEDVDASSAGVPAWRLVFLTISLCLGLFLSLLDTSVVATALYTIGASFDTLSTVTWVALAYTLAYVGFTVIIAFLADVIGRRNAYITAGILFIAASLGCGFSQSLEALIACRALQGIGGSGLYSLTMVILPEVYPLKKHALFGGIIGAVVAMAGVMGPVLGGAITTTTTWRWVFWINVPIGLVALALFCIAWPKPSQLRPTPQRRLGELDFLGCVLMIAASVLVVFSFQKAGLGSDTWATALFLAPLLIGSLSWALLFGWEALVACRWERSVAAIFPLRLLKHRVYMMTSLVTMVMGFPYFVIIYGLPMRFQVVNQKSALDAGVGLLPMLGGSAIGSMLGGVLSSKKNRAFETSVAGACLMVLGTAFMSTLSNTLDVEPKTYGYQVSAGLGFGLTVSTASFIAGVETEPRDNAVAQGIVSQARIFGGSIDIAMTTAVLGATQRRELAGLVDPARLASLQDSAAGLTPTQLQAARQAQSDAFSQSLQASAAVAGAGVLFALLAFRRRALDVAKKGKQGFDNLGNWNRG